MQSQANETLESPSLASKESLEAWNRWISFVFTPRMKAKEFLCRWRRAFLAILHPDLLPYPGILGYLQFVHAVKSHPELKKWEPKLNFVGAEWSQVMSDVYEEFLDVTEKIATSNRLVVFVARSPVGEDRVTEKRLVDDLELLKVAYENNYGPLESRYEFFTFEHDSRELFLPRCDVITYFEKIRSELETIDGRLIVVINGWDGLTAYFGNLIDLFSDWSERVTLRIYAQESTTKPREFFQANVCQLCDILAEKLLFNDDNPNKRAHLIDDMPAISCRAYDHPLLQSYSVYDLLLQGPFGTRHLWN